MNNQDLHELLDAVQEQGPGPSTVSSQEIEEVILDLMASRGIVPECHVRRQIYKRFFNRIRYSETQYNKARDNLEGIEKAVSVVRKALLRLDEELQLGE